MKALKSFNSCGKHWNQQFYDSIYYFKKTEPAVISKIKYPPNTGWKKSPKLFIFGMLLNIIINVKSSLDQISVTLSSKSNNPWAKI